MFGKLGILLSGRCGGRIRHQAGETHQAVRPADYRLLGGLRQRGLWGWLHGAGVLVHDRPGHGQ